MLGLALTATAGAVVAWILDRRRTHRRNEQGRCGSCGTPWAEGRSGETYLIHGHLVCETCAEKAKRRMPWELGALAAWAMLLSGLAVTNLAIGSAKGVAFFVAASAGAVVFGTVQLMKLANRSAQRRIAAGEFPGYGALGPEAIADTEATLAQGDADAGGGARVPEDDR